MNRSVERAEQVGRTGLGIGALYEARARLAIAAGDRAGFELFAERCASAYALARNPALSLKFAALMAEAQRHELIARAPLPEGDELVALVSQQDSEYATVQSRIAECVGSDDRARCALTILLQSLDSFAGYLYGIDEGKVRVLAGLPEGATDPGLDEWAAATLAAELDCAAGGATATAEGGGDLDTVAEPSVSKSFIDQDGRSFEPILLVSAIATPPRAAALLLVQYPAGPRSLGSRTLLCEIADLLLDNGDVRGSAL